MSDSDSNKGADMRRSSTTCYRLLDVDDKIRGTDEFLEDDGESWSQIDWNHSWNIGHYWHTALKPMRRVLGDNVKGHRTPNEGSDHE